MKRIMLLIFLLGLSVFSLTSTVGAREGIFIVDPMQEVTDEFELTVSDTVSAEICGNVSVIDGFIDFYVTSPLGNLILCYNRTSFNSFNFSATENGTYVLHLVNTETEKDVTATLNYGVNFKVTVQETIRMWHSIAYQFTLSTPPSHPIPFDKIFQLLKQILENIFDGISTGCFLLAWRIWNSIKGLRRGRPPDYHKVD